MSSSMRKPRILTNLKWGDVYYETETDLLYICQEGPLLLFQSDDDSVYAVDEATWKKYKKQFRHMGKFE